MEYFKYGIEEMKYLSETDSVLGDVIAKIGKVNRAADSDLFSAVLHHIVGQQISTKAQATIYRRLQDLLGEVNEDTILNVSDEQLQSIGITFKKVFYMKDFARKVKSKEIDLDALWEKSDKEVIRELSSLKGIGVWTAEMILLFCMQRKDILSYDDLAIQRGLRMVYHHRKITKQLFRKYQRRYSPYGSVASLYLWAVAGGAIPEMKDYKPKGTRKK